MNNVLEQLTYDHNITRYTRFTSTKALLEAGVSCRESANSKGWSIYWMEFGRLTLFPGSEGPQEASDIDEIIEWVGGDQPCYLTPASLKRFGQQE